MATYTENYNLKKPATTDQVNIEDLNGNADIIDAALAEKANTADVSGKYTKPAGGIPATDLAADVQASLDKADTAVQATEKGTANGVATLDGAGKVPAAQLPSYVDDVIEGYYYNGAFYSDSDHTTPITAETGKIYVDIDSSKSYRYSGSAFYRIDEITVDATPTAGSSNPVSSGGAYTALAGKVDKEAGKGLSTNDYTNEDKQALAAKYEKPAGGIPASDLSESVQTSLSKAENAINFFDDIPGTVQTVSFDSNGKPTSIVHSVNGVAARTDVFVWEQSSVTETRTLADGRYIVLATNLTTLVTTISDIQEAG